MEMKPARDFRKANRSRSVAWSPSVTTPLRAGSGSIQSMAAISRPGRPTAMKTTRQGSSCPTSGRLNEPAFVTSATTMPPSRKASPAPVAEPRL